MLKQRFTQAITLSLLVILFSCGEKKTKQITSEPMTASGEFLFEGPNTLQGNFSLDMGLLSQEVGVDTEQISAVTLDAITLVFENNDQMESVESVLVQLVSNDLSLLSAGTLSTFSNLDNPLNVNADFDILPYIMDPSSQLIVDANLTTDMDDLSVSVIFQLTAEY